MVTRIEIVVSILSALISATVQKASSCIPLLIGLQCGLNESDLFELVTCMRAALAVLAKAQRSPSTDVFFHKLVELKGVIYKAYDFLGDLEHQHSEQWSNGRYRQRCLIKREDDLVTNLRRIQNNLELVTCSLKGVVEVHAIDHWEKQVENPGGRFKEETSNFLPKHVFGREQEKDSVVNLLLNFVNRSDDMPVISILGPPGVGKTTMAQFVCDDPRVKAYFNDIIWLHTACEPFDVSVFLKEILEYLPNGERHTSDLRNLGNLQKIISEKLRSKRFLLVFDDMWNTDESKFENLLGPLRGLQGSILVTSQCRKVAWTIGATDTIVLEGLPNESNLSLFNAYAFGFQNSITDLRLKAIEEETVGKFKGSPLAAKTLGSKLRANRGEDWRYILEESKNDILQVIKPSYSRLSPQLQQCVSFCSLFRKDHEFDKESIIQMWIANDYIKPEGTMRIEDVGSRYFGNLVDRYFFHKQPNGCHIMHPLLHDLAQFVSKDEFFTIEDGNSQSVIPDTVRHLSVQHPIELSRFTDLCKDKKLQTLLLFIEFGPDLCSALSELKSEISSIRILDLGPSDIEKLPNTCKWKRLRYFDASNTKIRRLPECFSTFYKLQVLKVLNGSLECLPRNMSKLIRLRYLDVDDGYVSRIRAIGKLTSLQELKHYKVLNKNGHMIGELKDMNELRGSLRISNLENVGISNVSGHAVLEDKSCLHEVTLEWSSNRNASMDIDEHKNVLEGLKPHGNLRALEINSYGGSTNPNWLEDQSLPKLEDISFKNCLNLQSLPSGLSMVPTLKSLTIENCPKLKLLPENGLPEVLSSFILHNCPDLKEKCRKETGSDWLKIAHIDHISFDGECVSQSFDNNHSEFRKERG